MLLDERALLTRIAQGDQEALKCLYAAYRSRLWSYLWRQLDRDTNWTEELVQDVLLAVWRSAGSYRGEAQVATWLFRIAHNLAANARRARARRIQPEPLEDADDGQEQSDAGLSHLPEDRILDRLALTEALDQLSPRHREVLHLAFYQGFAPSEIAGILSVPVGTVKSRLSYARRALQAQLAQTSPQ
jgi:RNA polymerase sigma-70 factor (ECF subfamily)